MSLPDPREFPTYYPETSIPGTGGAQLLSAQYPKSVYGTPYDTEAEGGFGGFFDSWKDFLFNAAITWASIATANVAAIGTSSYLASLGNVPAKGATRAFIDTGIYAAEAWAAGGLADAFEDTAFGDFFQTFSYTLAGRAVLSGLEGIELLGEIDVIDEIITAANEALDVTGYGLLEGANTLLPSTQATQAVMDGVAETFDWGAFETFSEQVYLP